jgi:hypothetical protein
MVNSAEWLVAAHRDDLIRQAEQARLIRRCRAQDAAQKRPVRSATDKARTTLLRHLRRSGALESEIC